MTLDRMCLNCKRKLAKNPNKIEENEVIQLFNCGRCKVVSYCSKRCQKENHALHKIFCKAWVESECNTPMRDFYINFDQRYFNPPPSNVDDFEKMLCDDLFQKRLSRLCGEQMYNLAVFGENWEASSFFVTQALEIIKSIFVFL